MKKIILALGFGLFLMAFSMHLKTSVDSPLGLVTEEALGEETGGGSGVMCECRGLFFKSCKAADSVINRQCAPTGTNNCSRYDDNC